MWAVSGTVPIGVTARLKFAVKDILVIRISYFLSSELIILAQTFQIIKKLNFFSGPVPNQPLRAPTNCWKKYPGLLKQVDVGPYGVWGVNSQDDIWRKTSTSWQRIPGALKDISVGKSSVWGVNSNDEIFRKSGGDWQKVGGLLKQVIWFHNFICLTKLLRFLYVQHLTLLCGESMHKKISGVTIEDKIIGKKLMAVSLLFPVEEVVFGVSTMRMKYITGKELMEEAQGRSAVK